MARNKRFWCTMVLALLLIIPAGAEEKPTLMDLYTTWGMTGFPDDVAGVYYDADQRLVLSLVWTDPARAAELQAMVCDPDSFTIRYVTYPYNALARIQAEIWKDMDGDPALVESWISQADNRVVAVVTEDRYAHAARTYAARYGDAVVVQTASEAEGSPETGAGPPAAVCLILVVAAVWVLAAGTWRSRPRG